MPCSNLKVQTGCIRDCCNVTGGCEVKRQDGIASCSHLRTRSGALLETSTSYKVRSSVSRRDGCQVSDDHQFQLAGQPETGAGGILHLTMLQWRGFLRPDPAKQCRFLSRSFWPFQVQNWHKSGKLVLPDQQRQSAD